MKTIQIILLILIIIGLGLIFTQKFWVESLVNFILSQTNETETSATKNDPLNTTYKIGDKQYALIGGKAGDVMIFGEPVYGDLNSDGVDDAALYLVQNPGGSGTFFYIAEAINFDGHFVGTDAMFLGDRIAPQNINITEGIAVANFAERKVGEPMTAKPSIGKSVWVHLDVKKMQIGEWVKDFEGETNI